MLKKTFVAIDFETANYARNSACAVAIVRVESGQITQQEYKLIQPPTLDFTFTHIHGITAEQVENEPYFATVWNSISYLTEGIDCFVAHNAPFDKGVLDACCEHENINIPNIPFECTLSMARKRLNLTSNKLPDVCHYFNIPLNHHDALSDARACAHIALALQTL